MTIDDILQEKVSVFANRLSTEKYGDFSILSILKGLKQYEQQTMKAKMFHDRYLKDPTEINKRAYDNYKLNNLNCATFSTLFEKYRGEEYPHVLTHTISLDVDHIVDEQHLTVDYVKDAMMSIDSVYYCQCSASGNGVWALAAVEDPNDRDRIYDYYKKILADKDIKLDKLVDISRFRFLTYDEDNMIKVNNVEILSLPPEEKKEPKKLETLFVSNNEADFNYRAVEFLLRDGYGYSVQGMRAWCSEGYLLGKIFGESGRQLWYMLCEQSPNKKSNKECENFYTKACRQVSQPELITIYFSRLKSRYGKNWRARVNGIK